MAANSNVSRVADPYKAQWFADCAPSLLTNRTIRRYLNAYSQHTWPEVIKLILIYGVLGLEQQFPGGTLSISQLRQLVEKGGAQLVVERHLPGLQRQILNLQTNLDAVFDKLVVEAPASAAVRSVPARQAVVISNNQQQAKAQHQLQQQGVQEVAVSHIPAAHRPATALNPGPVAPKAPDSWRQGGRTGFPSPPRDGSNPLRRSVDNQGATNPIYPDWWLAAGPAAPPPPKRVQKKAQRTPPRLAYSVHKKQHVPSAADDDLVTAEYLMVPGSGYGQAAPAPVVAGSGPAVTITSITSDSISTKPLQEPRPQGAAPAARPTAGARAGVDRGVRHTGAVPSKIKEAVAASHLKADAQQQRKQQQLARAVAAGSSSSRHPSTAATQQQGRAGSRTAADEAVALCAPAAAAEQFLSNPWTSSFLPAAAVKADVVGYCQLPAADIAADDEGRLGALGDAAACDDGQDHGLRAPAALAALQSVVAAADAAGAAVPVPPVSRDMQEQQQHYKGLHKGPSDTAADAHSLDRQGHGMQPTGSSRGVFADITSVLNSHAGHQVAPAHKPGAAGATSASGSLHLYPSHTAASCVGGEMSLDWRSLPLIDEEEAEQQTQQHPYPRQQAWAYDYGHLEDVQPPPKVVLTQRRAAGKPHKRWSETWVGDFGHLQDFPRFQHKEAAHHQPDESAAEVRGAAGRVFMTPADLQALVVGVDMLGAPAADAAASGASTPERGNYQEAVALTGVGAAAAGNDAAESSAISQGNGSRECSLDAAAAAHNLADRFADLLARWDAQAAADAPYLPAGVASRGVVSFEGGHEGQTAAGSQRDALRRAVVGGQEAGSGVQQGRTLHGNADSSSTSALGVGTLELQSQFQHPAMKPSPAAGSAGADMHKAPQGAAAGDEHAAANTQLEHASLPSNPSAEVRLESVQEASQILQQALTRHDALMELIEVLASGPGSGSDGQLSPTASSSI